MIWWIKHDPSAAPQGQNRLLSLHSIVQSLHQPRAALNRAGTMDSEALVAVGGTEGSQLHWSLGGNNLGRAVGSNVDTLGLLLLDLLLDPEVGEPQPILHVV
jgi:hypothetical protein